MEVNINNFRRHSTNRGFLKWRHVFCLFLSGGKLLSLQEDSLLELGGYFDLAIDFCQEFQLYQKVLQTKVVQN